MIARFNMPNNEPQRDDRSDDASTGLDGILDPSKTDGSVFLAKATEDCWRYLVQLRNGTIIKFEFAELRGDFIHLNHAEIVEIIGPGFEQAKDGFYFGRGVEVRVSDIVLVADCDS